MSETILLGGLLALVGGFLDAYTYLCRGKVFANAQTGNIVLLGIKIADGDVKGGFYYLLPIMAFVFGVIISEKIRWNDREYKHIHWRQMIILFEIAVLLVSTFMPKGTYDMAANIMVSFVCSLQVQSFRKFNGMGYATTMCTGNLRSGTEYLNKYWTTKEKTNLYNCIQYYGIIFCFIIGAAVGAVITSQYGIKAIWCACIGLLIVFLLMFIKEE